MRWRWLVIPAMALLYLLGSWYVGRVLGVAAQ
jgi:hypothetical protein